MGKIIRNTCALVGGVAIIGALLGVLILAFAGNWMRVNEPPVKADYIFPLAGNMNRMIKAAELYKEGYAPAILLSRPRILPREPLDDVKLLMGYPDYDLYQFIGSMLHALDAESAIVEPFGNGHASTVEEIEALKKHFNGRKPKLLLVTSPYHARRVKMVMQDIMPEYDFAITVSDDGIFRNDWWRDQDSAQHLVMEFAKTMHYLLGGAFRSTDK